MKFALKTDKWRDFYLNSQIEAMAFMAIKTIINSNESPESLFQTSGWSVFPSIQSVFLSHDFQFLSKVNGD